MLLLVGTVVGQPVQFESRDPAILRKADLRTPMEGRTDAADVVLFLLVDAHHHRRVDLLREQRRNGHGDRSGHLAAEPSAGVLADHDDLAGVNADPPRHCRNRLGRALRGAVQIQFPVLPVRHRRPALEGQIGCGRRAERLVKDERCFLEPVLDVAIRPLERFVDRLAHGHPPFAESREVGFRPFDSLDASARRRGSGPSLRGRLSGRLAAWGGDRDPGPHVALGPRIGRVGPQRDEGVDGKWQRLEVDLNFLDRLRRGELVDGGDGQYRLALVQRLVRQGVFTERAGLNHRAVVGDAVRRAGQVVGGQNPLDPGHRERGAGVDARDPRMGQRAQQELREQHAVRTVVFRVLRSARHLGDEVRGRVIVPDVLVFSHDHALRRFWSAERIAPLPINSRRRKSEGRLGLAFVGSL